MRSYKTVLPLFSPWNSVEIEVSVMFGQLIFLGWSILFGKHRQQRPGCWSPPLVSLASTLGSSLLPQSHKWQMKPYPRAAWYQDHTFIFLVYRENCNSQKNWPIHVCTKHFLLSTNRQFWVFTICQNSVRGSCVCWMLKINDHIAYLILPPNCEAYQPACCCNESWV